MPLIKQVVDDAGRVPHRSLEKKVTINIVLILSTPSIVSVAHRPFDTSIIHGRQHTLIINVKKIRNKRNLEYHGNERATASR